MAQVSDADREAARNLYKEGFDLQTAGSYADALERFRRAQQVFPAPTTLLHIAECEARLGHLVEAAETYRSLARVQLPPSPPPPWTAAMAQGAAELQQIEPRIPRLRLDVTPANAPGLAVWIDEQPLNPALLGVDRPINPGEHKLTAQASAFGRTEVIVKVEEKQTPKAVMLELKPVGPGVLPAPGYLPPPYPGQPMAGVPQVVYVQGPPPGYGPYGAPVTRIGPPPPVLVVDPNAPVPSRKGIFFGPRVGGVYPVLPSSLSDVEGGFSLGLEFDFRFARRLYLGAVVDHGFLNTSSSSVASLSASTSSAATTNVDAVFGVITNPDKFGALFQIGVGYRTLSFSGSDGSGNPFSSSANGPELSLGAGLWIPIGEHFRLVPRIDTTLGSLSDTGSSGNGFAMVTFVLAAYPNFNFR